MTFMIDGVKVTSELPDFTREEAANYVSYVREHITDTVREIKVTLCPDGKVDVSYLAQGTKFERIRRITGC